MDHQGRDIEHGTDAVELVYRPMRVDITTGLRVREAYRRLTWLRRGAAALFVCLGLLLIPGRTPFLQVVVWWLFAVMVWGIPRLYAFQVQRNVQWQGEYRTTVTEDALSAVNDHCALTQRWTLFRGYRETAEYFVLLSRDRSIMWLEVLPKRGLLDPQDAERLRALLDRHLQRV
jgi:hypothetical protein